DLAEVTDRRASSLSLRSVPPYLTAPKRKLRRAGRLPGPEQPPTRAVLAGGCPPFRQAQAHPGTHVSQCRDLEQAGEIIFSAIARAVAPRGSAGHKARTGNLLWRVYFWARYRTAVWR